MNLLSTLLFSLAQAAPAPRPAVEPPSEPLLAWWQWLLLLVLIGLIVFYVMYKKKQNQ